MNIKKIEFITDKGISDLNEDNYILNNNLFMVFDGATSLNGYKNKQNLTGGFLASQIAKNIFLKYNKLNPEVLIEANNAIKKEMLKNNIDTTKPENLWSTVLSGIQLHNSKMSLLQIGDCSIYLKQKNRPLKRITEDQIEHLEIKAINTATELRKKNEFSGEKIIPHIIKHVSKANTSEGYGVLNGSKIPEKFIFHKEIPIKDIELIILTTDGFNSLEHKSKQHSFENIYSQKNSLSETLTFIREKENQDKQCLNFPRIKPHDDATAISIHFK